MVLPVDNGDCGMSYTDLFHVFRPFAEHPFDGPIPAFIAAITTESVPTHEEASAIGKLIDEAENKSVK